MIGENEIVLGRDVAEAARSKRKASTTVVFSVRLTVDDVQKLERLSRRTGHTTAQLVRDAIQKLEHEPSRQPGWTATVGLATQGSLALVMGTSVAAASTFEPEVHVSYGGGRT